MKRSLADEAARTIASFLSTTLSPSFLTKSQVDGDPVSDTFSFLSGCHDIEEIRGSVRSTLQRDNLHGYGHTEPLDEGSLSFNRTARSSISRAEYRRLVSLYPAGYQQERAHSLWDFNQTENVNIDEENDEDIIVREDDPTENGVCTNGLGSNSQSNRAFGVRRVSGAVHASIIVLGGFSFHTLDYTDEIEITTTNDEEKEEEDDVVLEDEDLYLAGPDPLRSPRVSLSLLSSPPTKTTTPSKSIARRSPDQDGIVVTLAAETSILCSREGVSQQHSDRRYLGLCVLQQATLRSKSSPETISWSSTSIGSENEQDEPNHSENANHYNGTQQVNQQDDDHSTPTMAELSLVIKRQRQKDSRTLSSSSSSFSPLSRIYRVTCQRKYILSTVNDGHTLCISIPFATPHLQTPHLDSSPFTSTQVNQDENCNKHEKYATRGRSIKTPLASSSSELFSYKKTRITARAFFLDDSLLGIAGVVCPTHDFAIRIVRPSVNDDYPSADSSDHHRKMNTINKVAEIIVNENSSRTNLSSSFGGNTSLISPPPPPPLILLLEPSNVATVWSGLSTSALSGKDRCEHSAENHVRHTLPKGMESLFLWVQNSLLSSQSISTSNTSTSLFGARVFGSNESKANTIASGTNTSTLNIGGDDADSATTTDPSSLPLTLTREALPKHIAVVMDGNGRWAKCRGLARSDGHRAGVNAIHDLIRSCRRLRIPFLTLYAFSSQNWARPMQEVETLMKLLAEFVEKDLEELCANGVRLLVNGDIAKLPGRTRSGLERMVEASRGNSAAGLTLCLALSYGGREEIIGGVTAACRAHKAGLLDVSSLTPDSFRAAFLPNPEVPDPCLLIRTSGELRVSNFLLWQIAYTELYVTPALWPDFDEQELINALVTFSKRERRFGKTSEQVASEAAASSSSSSPSLSLLSSNAVSGSKGSIKNTTGMPQAAHSKRELISNSASSASLGRKGEMQGGGRGGGGQNWRCGALVFAAACLTTVTLFLFFLYFYIGPMTSATNASPSISPALKTTPWPIPGPTVQRRERDL